MPELPEVETVRRGLARCMTGRRIVRAELRRPDLRRPFPPDLAERLDGARIGALTRRGKYILVELDDSGLLLLHLGMSGRITAGPASVPPERHDHVVLTLDDDTVVRFNDPRRFGLLDYITRGQEGAHPMLAGLGPEPLEPGFDAGYLNRALAGKMTPIKSALLDQRIVAGLGNIYVCEALHQARLSPTRAAGSLATRTGEPRERLTTLVAAIRQVLQAAIRRQARYGGDDDRFRVYDREGERCRRRGCPGTIRRIVQGGRSTFFCPVCQR
jgi:formamidopyrimidine-DNA glycosylase